MLEGTEGVCAAPAVQSEPVANGPWLDVEEARHFGLGAPLIEPEESQQAASDPVITLEVSALAQVLPLLGVQPEPSGRGLHDRLPLGSSSGTW